MSNSVMSKEQLHSKEYVKAGAGAGKTFRITKKLGNLIQQGDIAPEKILAVTFTNAAAGEMRQRIRTYLIENGLKAEAEKVKDTTISTIHGFGLSLIERFAFEVGISPKPRQLTEAEQNQLIRQALSEVSVIEQVLNDLSRYGYKGKFKGEAFETSVEEFKAQILQVIHKLRTLGKGSDTQEVQALIQRASAEIERLYGANLSKAETLNKGVWRAIEALKNAYPEKSVLKDLWGSNAASRKFVEQVYAATPEDIKSNWGCWVALQYAKAPNIEKSDDVQLALDIWDAAGKLRVHPGPLIDAKNHIHALLMGAGETLKQYQQAKEQSGLVDFSDMVHLANHILNNPSSLSEMIACYDCLIIDEFQDTNPLQFALLNRFQEAGVPTLIVGDLKQSIMGFQGADSRLFAGLLAKGEQSEDIQVDELTNNWRSTVEVMKFVNQVGDTLYGDDYQPLAIAPQAEYHSQLPAVHQLNFDTDAWALDGKSKKKHSMNKDALNTLAKHISDLLAEGVEVTDKHSNKKRALRPSDIAVLGADHSSLYNFSKVLNQFGIQTKITQSGFMQSEAVQWVINGIKYIADSNNHFAVLDLLTSSYANQALQPLLETYFQQHYFSDPAVDALHQISYKARLQTFAVAVSMVIDALDIWNKLSCREDYAQQRANVLKLIELAQAFEDTQPESLEAMGIYGKNLHSFIVWLSESVDNDGADKQPDVDLNAEQSVVLSTWHASKGLEWPVVMVLNIHKEFAPRLPSTDVAYQSDDINSMLDSSYVRLLFGFADNHTKEQMLEALWPETINTLKNLTYVALTRSRESLILPWFDNDKPNSMLGLIRPLFTRPDFDIKRTNMILADIPEEDKSAAVSNKLLACKDVEVTNTLAVVSPSAVHELQADKLTLNKVTVGDVLDLSVFDAELQANETGTWIHKFYEVGLLKEALLPNCYRLLPEALRDNVDKAALERQVGHFRDWLNQYVEPTSVQCEVSILSKNAYGQTISGMIDLLVETPSGYWIIDHKTDQTPDFTKHYSQLMAYASSLKLAKPVTHLAVNWVRQGEVEILTLD